MPGTLGFRCPPLPARATEFHAMKCETCQSETATKTATKSNGRKLRQKRRLRDDPAAGKNGASPMSNAPQNES